MGFALDGPTTIEVKQGGTATAIFRVLATSKPYRNVSLSITGLPSGISAQFSPTSGKPSFTSTLTVCATTTSATGTFTLMVKARDAKSSKTMPVVFRNYTVNIPPGVQAPVLTSLVPNNADAGNPQFTLQINGTGFISGATAYWDGSSRSTAFINSTRIDATILAGDVDTVGTAQVTATNPGSAVSNSLTFTINAAATYDWYVDITRPDNSGDGTTLATAKKNIANGIALMSGGDSLFIAAGTYTEQLIAEDMPDGTDFSTGTTKIVGAGVDVTIIKPSTGSAVRGVNVAKSNLEFRSFTAEAPDGYGIVFWDVNGLRLRNIKVYQTAFQGIQITGAVLSDNIDMEDIEVSRAGVPNGTPNCNGTTAHGGYCHGFYFQFTHNLTANRIRSYDNNGSGWQFYQDMSNCEVRNLLIYRNRDQQNDAGSSDPPGMYVTDGSRAYNVSAYDNEDKGIWVVDTGATLKNAIAYNNGGAGQIYIQPGQSPTLSNNLETNPSWQDPANGDFRLTSSSTNAIDQGTTIAGFSGDYVGTTRPQGSAWDIGAYEYIP